MKSYQWNSVLDQVFLWLSYLFIILSIYFKIKENAVALYQEYQLPMAEKYTWTIPMKEMRRQMQKTQNPILKKELQKSLKNRYLFFISLGGVFICMILTGISHLS